MNKNTLSASLLIGMALAALPAAAQSTYNGPGTSLGGSLADGAGISSVVVNNDANNLTFTINSSDPQASYIFYALEFQIVGQAGSGYMGFANPFGPAVGISSGENAVIDTFGSGATAYSYSGGFINNGTVNYTAGGTGDTFSTFTVSLASLGMSLGESFHFDVVSTYTSQQNGGPQAAYGALDSTGYPSESDGAYTPYNGTAHYDSATDSTSTFNNGTSLYTIQVAPEPTTCALLGLGFAGMMGLRRRAK
jgi:PEP-CTERM motif